jgi:hypothetical protein
MQTWALYDAEAAGFSPNELKFKRTRNGVVVERPYKPSGSGCG